MCLCIIDCFIETDDIDVFYLLALIFVVWDASSLTKTCVRALLCWWTANSIRHWTYNRKLSKTSCCCWFFAGVRTKVDRQVTRCIFLWIFFLVFGFVPFIDWIESKSHFTSRLNKWTLVHTHAECVWESPNHICLLQIVCNWWQWMKCCGTATVARIAILFL